MAALFSSAMAAMFWVAWANSPAWAEISRVAPVLCSIVRRMLSIASTTLRAPAAICCAAVAIPVTSATVTSTAPRISSSALPAWSAFCEPASTWAEPLFIALTASFVPAWTLRISSLIDLVSRWLLSASLRTSSATTAKPRPCSPALAASMAAFSASRLVCSAMSSIVSTTAPIRSPSFPSSSTRDAASDTTLVIAWIDSTVSRTAAAPRSAESRV
ncbi:MAG TPA: hypothetical protein VFH48_32845 [Chloroflexota bacterium]|nr:hypothetical protein [Chloroflexota bacterium]